MSNELIKTLSVILETLINIMTDIRSHSNVDRYTGQILELTTMLRSIETGKDKPDAK